MRECQLCGAKSWGPLESPGRALVLMAVRPEDKEVDFTAYRQCDNCNMPALTEIIEKPADIPTVSAESAFSAIGLPPLPLSPEGILEKFSSIMPKSSEPETRLERLVRALIGQFEPAGWADYPADIVSTARKIEQEIGKAP